MYYCKNYLTCKYRTETSYCSWDKPIEILLKNGKVIIPPICSKTKEDVRPELTEFELLMQRTIDEIILLEKEVKNNE